MPLTSWTSPEATKETLTFLRMPLSPGVKCREEALHGESLSPTSPDLQVTPPEHLCPNQHQIIGAISSKITLHSSPFSQVIHISF